MTPKPTPPPKKTPAKAPAKKTPAPSSVAPAPPPVNGGSPVAPEAFYDDGGKDYWIKTPSGEFISCSESTLKRMLKIRGFSAETARGLPSECDEWIHTCQQTRYVRYAGGLAGYDAGLQSIMGKPILVTESPTILAATHGTNMMMAEYVERLLGDQSIYFHCWVKLAREALLNGSLRRGQALVLAGDRDHGKSLLVKMTSRMLGGRVANPWQFLRGLTSFNEDLFSAELLVMDDQGSEDSWKLRKQFGDGIKQFTGDTLSRCHGKGKRPLTLTPFWRLMVVLNDEPEDLQVLPPLTRGTADKLIILKTIGRAIDVKTSGSGQFAAYLKALEGSVPDYLGWLESWEIPEDYLDDRFGLAYFHHPDIVEALEEFTPELKLLHLIDADIFSDTKEESLMVTARELEARLKGGMHEREAHDLLKGWGSCGKYLARLIRVREDRVRPGGRVPGGGSTRYELLRGSKVGQGKRQESV